MIDPRDNSFAARLERQLRFALNGDEKTNGLYKTLLNAQNWEDFIRLRERVMAFEWVLQVMRDTSNQINSEEEPRGADEQPRPRIN